MVALHRGKECIYWKTTKNTQEDLWRAHPCCTAFMLLVFQVFHLTRARSTMNPLFKSSIFVLKGHNLNWTSSVMSNMHNSFQGIFYFVLNVLPKMQRTGRELLHHLGKVGFKCWSEEAAELLMELSPMLGWAGLGWITWEPSHLHGTQLGFPDTPPPEHTELPHGTLLVFSKRSKGDALPTALHLPCHSNCPSSFQQNSLST